MRLPHEELLPFIAGYSSHCQLAFLSFPQGRLWTISKTLPSTSHPLVHPAVSFITTSNPTRPPHHFQYFLNLDNSCEDCFCQTLLPKKKVCFRLQASGFGGHVFEPQLVSDKVWSVGVWAPCIGSLQSIEAGLISTNYHDKITPNICCR